MTGMEEFKLIQWSLGYLNEILDELFKLNLVTDGWGTSYEIAFRWFSLNLTDDELTLIQVVARCRQTTSHYLSNVDLDLFRHVASQGHNVLIISTHRERQNITTNLHIPRFYMHLESHLPPDLYQSNLPS